MCGIVGFVTLAAAMDWSKKRDWLNRALFVDTLRGEDSTGIFCVPKTEPLNAPLIYKKAVSGPDFIQLNATKRLLMDTDKYFCVVGHNRKATVGSIRNETAHPFQHGHITLVHNGTLDSTAGIGAGHTVDSEGICKALCETEPKKLLEEIEGAFTLVWYNHKDGTLHLARNKERPLSFCVTKNGETMFFASLPWMIDCLMTQGITLDKVYDLRVGAHVIISHDAKNADDYVVEEFKPAEPKALPYYGHPRSGTGSLYETNKSLSFLGYNKGELIVFQGVSYAKYTNNSPNGNLYGQTLVSPFDDIVAYQVEVSRVGKLNRIAKRKFVGTVAWSSWRNNVPQIVVENVQLFDAKQHGHLVKTKSIPKKKQQDDGVNYDDPQLLTMVIGPDNRLITEEKYEELVKHGCAHCTSDLSVDDAEDIIWLNDDRPLCMDCQNLFSMKNH